MSRLKLYTKTLLFGSLAPSLVCTAFVFFSYVVLTVACPPAMGLLALAISALAPPITALVWLRLGATTRLPFGQSIGICFLGWFLNIPAAAISIYILLMSALDHK